MSLTSKDGKELVKREITIADDTATSMTIALWAERAQQEDKVFEGNPVVTLKSVAVKDWQGSRSGSLLQSGGGGADFARARNSTATTLTGVRLASERLSSQ